MEGQGAIAPAEATAWIDAARPGENRVYAWGDDRPPALPVVALVRRERDAGRITTALRKISPGRYEYVMQRLAARARLDRSNAHERDLAAERAVMRALRSAAAHERPCPSDARLADIAGIGTAEDAGAAVERLRAKRLIFVRHEGLHQARVVQIASSGARTKRERRG